MIIITAMKQLQYRIQMILVFQTIQILILIVTKNYRVSLEKKLAKVIE